MKRAFVVMSFLESYRRVYFEALKPALEESGYYCFRADEEPGPGNIPAEIVRALISSDLVVADVSESSPNVYYELGISHCLGNKTITITQSADRLPFDIRVFRALQYEITTNGLRLLRSDLKTAVKALEGSAGRSGANLVQEAGREYFDLEGQIRKNLQEIREERERLKAFSDFQDRRSRTEPEDNTHAADRISAHIGEFIPGREHRLLVCICGSGAIGKSTFARLLADRLKIMHGGRFSVAVLPTDSYMLPRAVRLARNILGFDPGSHDFSRLKQDVEGLLAGRGVSVTPYDHQTGEHSAPIQIQPSDVIILEGIYSFYAPLAPLCHSFRYFLYADPLRARELKFIADFTERDHDIQTAFLHAESEYQAYARFILPSVNFANFVLHVDGYWKYSDPAPADSSLYARAMSHR